MPGTPRHEGRSRLTPLTVWPRIAEGPSRAQAQPEIPRANPQKPAMQPARTATGHRIEPGVDIKTAFVERQRPSQRGTAKHAFDELKVNLLTRYSEEAMKSVLFLGISRGTGVSTAAYNFARSLAQDAEARVLLINADLRNVSPPDHTAAPSKGLANIPEGDHQVLLPARQDNIHVLPCGSDCADPAVLFQSRRFTEFLGEMSKQYDYVVLDGPPIDEAPESIALSSKVDGVILVIDASRTRGKIALRAKKRIEESGGRLLGAVLNRRRYYVPDWLYRMF
jgi:capsular exopolysaccharide synthesis family protein